MKWYTTGNKRNKNWMQCNTEKPFPEVSIQGRCEDISKEGGKEGHTVSNRGYSPDYHVDLHAVLIKGLQRGWGLRAGPHLRTLSPLNTSLLTNWDLINVVLLYMKNQDFGKLNLSSQEFLRKMRMHFFCSPNLLFVRIFEWSISQLSPLLKALLSALLKEQKPTSRRLPT